MLACYAVKLVLASPAATRGPGSGRERNEAERSHWLAGIMGLVDWLKGIGGSLGGISTASVDQLSRRLSAVVFVGAMILVAHELADLTWALVPAPDLSAHSDSPAVLSAQQSRAATVDAAPVVRAHLFGKAGTGKPTRRVVDAPETKLNLVLRGVFFSPETNEARAIIASSGGDDRPYGAGDTLPGGAAIEEIQVDRVLLRRNNRLEVLRLPKDKDAFARGRKPLGALRSPARGKRAEARRIDYRSNRQLARSLGRYRRQLEKNPERLADLARIEPAMQDGRLLGYKLAPAKNARLLNRFGLRPGDVLVELNGINLSEPSRGFDALAELSNANELSVDVLRDGDRLSFSFRVEP